MQSQTRARKRGSHGIRAIPSGNVFVSYSSNSFGARTGPQRDLVNSIGFEDVENCGHIFVGTVLVRAHVDEQAGVAPMLVVKLFGDLLQGKPAAVHEVLPGGADFNR